MDVIKDNQEVIQVINYFLLLYFSVLQFNRFMIFKVVRIDYLKLSGSLNVLDEALEQPRCSGYLA